MSVCVVDADRNRSATVYSARGILPFEGVPAEAAAKATRHAYVIIIDGQARSHEDELKNLSAGAVEFTVELSSMLRQMGTMHTALLVKVDRRQQPLAQNAHQILDGFGVDVMQAEIPLLAALKKQRWMVGLLLCGCSDP